MRESILSQKPRTTTTGQLRRFAINILSLDSSKQSTRNKRKRADWNENYFLYCLAAINKGVVARPWRPGRDGRWGNFLRFAGEQVFEVP